MSTPETILTKVKLLLNLANSPNPNEAENARVMADKLIAKYNITQEELDSLKDKPSPYVDDIRLFHTVGISSWRQQLALALAKNFFCKIVQEKLVPNAGSAQYNYYIFGEPEDVENVKFAFPILVKKVEELVDRKCIGRGGIFVTSYCEGVAEAIINRIHWNDIEIPKIKSSKTKQESVEKAVTKSSQQIEKHKEEVETPTKESVSVDSQRDLIKDITAYYKGLMDGKDFSLDDVLEIMEKNEEPEQLS